MAREASYVPLNQMNFQGYPLASAWTRLFAQIIDAVAFCICVALGIVLYFWLVKLGLPLEDPKAFVEGVLIRYSNPCFDAHRAWLLLVLQWTLLTLSGQTIGKKILMIRVVTDHGELPGFIRAVLIREWARHLLCLVPWVGPWFRFLDPLFIFTDSRKCLHDHIAGTRVVALI